MSEEDHKKRKLPTIFAVFGWLMGSLSLLNLAKDLTPLELHGALKQWVIAYGVFVHSLSDLLFGWLSWRWIALDRVEAHLTVIMVLLTSAVVKALFVENRYRGGSKILAAGVSGGIVLFLLPFLAIVLLLPSYFGTILGALYLVIQGYVWNFVSVKEDLAPPENVRQQIITVIATFALVVIVNYLFLRPH
ncbi:MAG TPA: hypothetical protein VF645_06145 [Allosphingosinicella sp.]